MAALLAAGAAATLVVGTPRADVLRGTPRADVLRGLGGADLLAGNGGRDRLEAGGGSDRVQAFDGAADRVSCGAGRDIVSVDRADVAARDCEVVSRAISGDGLRGGAGQHRTQVEPHAASFGETVVATFQVARIESGGAMAIGWATSRDSGRTWRFGLLPRLTPATRPAGPFRRASDPVAAYDSAHDVWLVATLGLGARTSALAISRSSDGARWSAPVIAASGPGLAFDKEWIACDNSSTSPFHGRCYLSYTDVDREVIATRFSTDGGLTWSGPVYPPDRAGHAGAEGRYAPGVQPVVQPDGTLVIPYYDEQRMAAVRSDDGGVSYDVPVTIAPAEFDQPPALRAPPLPTAAVDAQGTIHVAWPDCRARPACRGNDVAVSRSADGRSWSAPKRLRPRAGSAVLPALAATGRGRLALTYYVLTGGRLGVRAASSANGAATWSQPTRLDAEAMKLSWVALAGGAMVGDYVATVFAGNRPLSVFSLAGRAGTLKRQAIFATRR